MQCSFCHSYLDNNEIRDQNLLKLCCGINQIFCYHCLFSPTIIESWILSKDVLICQDCGSEISMETLLKKRMHVNLGFYSKKQLQFGFSYFLKPTVVNSPPSSNYGDIYEIQQKLNNSKKNSSKFNTTKFSTAESEKQANWSTPKKEKRNQEYQFTPQDEQQINF